MNEKNSSRVLVFLLVLVAICTAVCYYLVCVRPADSRDIDRTIQRIEENNDRARNDVESATIDNQQAQTELANGQRDLNDAQQSVTGLQESADERAGLTDDAEQRVERSQQLTQRQRDIYREIDEANKISGTTK